MGFVMTLALASVIAVVVAVLVALAVPWLMPFLTKPFDWFTDYANWVDEILRRRRRA